jgi:hypothetical protein
VSEITSSRKHLQFSPSRLNLSREFSVVIIDVTPRLSILVQGTISVLLFHGFPHSFLADTGMGYLMITYIRIPIPSITVKLLFNLCRQSAIKYKMAAE